MCIFMGDVLPASCKKKRCNITKTLIIKGRIKCSAKNRDNVALLTLKPPQTQKTNFCPIIGIVAIKFVITEAPQKDICPQGKTYPKKATPIEKR